MPEYQRMTIREMLRNPGGLESKLIEVDGVSLGATLDAHGIFFYAWLRDDREDSKLLAVTGNETQEKNAWVVSLLNAASMRLTLVTVRGTLTRDRNLGANALLFHQIEYANQVITGSHYPKS